MKASPITALVTACEQSTKVSVCVFIRRLTAGMLPSSTALSSPCN